ncbi:MAG TPA: EscU/YscU/HrcU family type III secretion system export apparatus switch protein [Candidatus Acidoferrales bacterium]|jgi:flagellar biosynthetic protein FlhB|nr:EscU/YscU/HrcU family type III secretion system export apparatus switch protein [Candidatus Acidoferrales bacterium]
MADNRSEKATARRKQKAREKGQVVRSRDLASALTLLASIVMLSWQSHDWIEAWRSLFERLLTIGRASDLGIGTPIFYWTLLSVGRGLAPVLTLALAVSLFSHSAQGGFVFVTESLRPNWERFNPASNIGQIFSAAGLSRLLRSLVPFTVMVVLGANVFERDFARIAHSARLDSRGLLMELGSMLLELSWKFGLVMLAWSGLDYFLQRRNYEQSLRMTKQEVKQESKDTDGNPLIRGRIRRLRRALMRKMLAKDVQRATAVITNPTHYAVALEYRPETMSAPVVVAKGRNLLAERIKQLARWHEIPIIENRILAQALYKTTDVGQPIPPQLYAAVAEILAFLYRAQARLLGQKPGAAN